jgi:hypothetical protein
MCAQLLHLSLGIFTTHGLLRFLGHFIFLFREAALLPQISRAASYFSSVLKSPLPGGTPLQPRNKLPLHWAFAWAFGYPTAQIGLAQSRVYN